MSRDERGARWTVEVRVAVASVVVCLGPSPLGLGGEWVDRFRVLFGPLHGCLLDSVGVERDGGGPGERPWEGFLGPGSICDPQFVGWGGVDGRLGLG